MKGNDFMTNKEKLNKIKGKASATAVGVETLWKGGAGLILLKLLYKQKIKPITAIFLLLAYKFNKEETRCNCYDNFVKLYKAVDGYEDSYSEKKDYRTMGFKID